MERFTRQERLAGAQLAEWPGNPAEFPIEKMGAVEVAIIRRSLAERKRAAAERGSSFRVLAD